MGRLRAGSSRRLRCFLAPLLGPHRCWAGPQLKESRKAHSAKILGCPLRVRLTSDRIEALYAGSQEVKKAAESPPQAGTMRATGYHGAAQAAPFNETAQGAQQNRSRAAELLPHQFGIEPRQQNQHLQARQRPVPGAPFTIPGWIHHIATQWRWRCKHLHFQQSACAAAWKGRLWPQRCANCRSWA